jgi:transcription antitermination factor NusG
MMVCLSQQPLFVGYCFITIELQWHAARSAPGVFGLIMSGAGVTTILRPVRSRRCSLMRG